MSRLPWRAADAHERARALAAQSIDEPLDPADSDWMSRHLLACPECRTAAGEYRDIHAELHKAPLPEPPRDLWARTAAALDAVDAARSGGSPTSRMGMAGSRRSLFATYAAVGAVIVLVVAALLAQTPLAGPHSSPGSTSVIALASPSVGETPGQETPLAVVNGKAYWVSNDGGVWQIMGASTECTADKSCTIDGGGGKPLGSIVSQTPVSVALNSDASAAVVWTDGKIAVVPLSTAQPTVPLDQLTPRPTLNTTPSATSATATSSSAATPAPTPTSTPTPAVTATARPTSTSASGSTEGAATSASTGQSSASPSPASSAEVASPAAILSGYEIVGVDPAFSPDGNLLAFAARPVDRSVGPDVFVWHKGEGQARAVTSRHADLFAGWFGGRILISRIGPSGSAGSASGTPANPGYASFVYDPATDDLLQIAEPMFLPVVDPTGTFVVYWSGNPEFDPATGLWLAGSGELSIARWSELTLASPNQLPAPTQTPAPARSASSPQPTSSAEAIATGQESAAPSPTPEAAGKLPEILPVAAAPASVHVWLVRWDATGDHLAVWVADPNSSRIGRLGLFSVDRSNAAVNVNEPLLAAEKVMDNVCFDDGKLVYSSAVDGKTYVLPVPSIPLSSVATPSTTVPGQLPNTAASPAPTALSGS